MKKKTTEDIESLQKQTEEWKNKYLRALADYQNLEKRKHEEVAQVRRYAGEHILTRFLPIIDTLEKAQEHLNDAGLALVLKELAAFHDEQGVKKLDTVGKPFNLHEMECIEVVDGEDGIVIEELLPGYTLHGKMIRIAQVKVGKKPESTNAESTNDQKVH